MAVAAASAEGKCVCTWKIFVLSHSVFGHLLLLLINHPHFCSIPKLGKQTSLACFNYTAIVGSSEQQEEEQ